MNYKVQHITNKNKLTNRNMKAEYITIHSTGNPNSTAQNERDNLNRNTNTTSTGFHIVVDEIQAIECIPLDKVAYHAGDGRNGPGNTRSIGVEMCESGNREKVINNTVKLVAQMLHDRNWTINRLQRHYDWSGKNCPRIMSANNWKEWDRFKFNVNKELIFLNQGGYIVAKLEKWQKRQGEDAIRSLARKGIIDEPERWIKELKGKEIPDWALWSIIDRITK